MRKYLVFIAAVLAHAPVTIELVNLNGPLTKRPFHEGLKDIRVAITNFAEEIVSLDRSKEIMVLLIGNRKLANVPDDELMLPHITVTVVKNTFEHDADIVIDKLAESFHIHPSSGEVSDPHVCIKYDKDSFTLNHKSRKLHFVGLALKRISVFYPWIGFKDDDGMYDFLKKVYTRIRQIQHGYFIDDTTEMARGKIPLENGLTIENLGFRGCILKGKTEQTELVRIDLRTFIKQPHVDLLRSIAADLAMYE